MTYLVSQKPNSINKFTYIHKDKSYILTLLRAQSLCLCHMNKNPWKHNYSPNQEGYNVYTS